MTTDPVVHLASASDAEAIAEMSRDHIEFGLGWRYTPERVLGLIRDPESNVAVIHEDGAVAAFGIMLYKEEHAHLSLLAVNPVFRRQGLASAILAWLEHAARVAGAERIGVECRRNNDPARCLYLEHGYHEQRIEAGMYRGQEDGICLEKWLRVRSSECGDA
jgi:[ribosomal protein S18]-alanine N-acetyltransferase